MPESLDYAELTKIAEKATVELQSIEALRGQHFRSRTIIRTALTAIAKRAFRQAARVECDELVIGKSTSHHPFFAPAIRLSDTCAALDAPASEIKEKP